MEKLKIAIIILFASGMAFFVFGIHMLEVHSSYMYSFKPQYPTSKVFPVQTSSENTQNIISQVQNSISVPTDFVIFHDAAIEETIRGLLKIDKGSITLSEIETLKDLDVLNISGDDCKDIQDLIKYLPNLKQLKLWYCSNDDICLKLSALKQLDHLELTYSGSTLNIDGLAQCSQLKSLYLNADQISISNISLLSKLKHLDLVYLQNVKQCDLKFISNIPSVKQVVLSYCEMRDVSAITNMHNLTKFVITCDREFNSPNGLATFTGIKENNNLKYAELKDGETLTGYSIVRDDNNTYEIFAKPNKIEGEKDPEKLYQGQVITILVEGKNSNSQPLQKISYTVGNSESGNCQPDFENIFYSVDVNFDSKKDILLLDGYFGNQGAAYYDCFLWDNKTNSFIKNDSFYEIPNVSIDQNSCTVLGCWRNWAASHSYAMYKYMDGKFVMISELTEEAVLDNTLKNNQERWKYTDERLKDGKMQIVDQLTVVSPGVGESEKFFKYGSYWDLNGDKWRHLDNSDPLSGFNIYDR